MSAAREVLGLGSRFEGVVLNISTSTKCHVGDVELAGARTRRKADHDGNKPKNNLLGLTCARKQAKKTLLGDSEKKEASVPERRLTECPPVGVTMPYPSLILRHIRGSSWLADTLWHIQNADKECD